MAPANVKQEHPMRTASKSSQPPVQSQSMVSSAARPQVSASIKHCMQQLSVRVPCSVKLLHG